MLFSDDSMLYPNTGSTRALIDAKSFAPYFRGLLIDFLKRI